MPKYIFALYAFLLLGCRIDRVPDYGSRDQNRNVFDGCLSQPTGNGYFWMLVFFILLTAVITWLIAKRGNGGK